MSAAEMFRDGPDPVSILDGKRQVLAASIKSACRHAPGWAVLEEEDRKALDRIAERSAELVYPVDPLSKPNNSSRN